jgi:hypothetical protein
MSNSGLSIDVLWNNQRPNLANCVRRRLGATEMWWVTSHCFSQSPDRAILVRSPHFFIALRHPSDVAGPAAFDSHLIAQLNHLRHLLGASTNIVALSQILTSCVRHNVKISTPPPASDPSLTLCCDWDRLWHHVSLIFAPENSS